ncbi:MAG: bis(5'-nucleosyl)-tetraphosphatase (symmetrical) YqeK [Bacillota bacterium]|nr:bis(5'-nucleosyl)-tetraphosphatase (symmetrical) YqeK [Bacillota bacterium]
MNYEEIESLLKKALTPERFKHTMGVVETSLKLAQRYGCDKEKTRYAALLHDCAKNYEASELKKLCRKYDIRLDHVSKRESRLLHAYVGAYMAKDIYGIEDEEIFDAIYFHTTGKKEMSLLCKIIFLADAIEPHRCYGERLDEIRKLAFENLDEALIINLDETIHYIINKGRLLHLDTLKARNFLLENVKG